MKIFFCFAKKIIRNIKGKYKYIKDIKNRLMMANENLLDEKIVLDRFKLINEKQKKDLDELCKYLFKETNEI